MFLSQETPSGAIARYPGLELEYDIINYESYLPTTQFYDINSGIMLFHLSHSSGRGESSSQGRQSFLPPHTQVQLVAGVSGHNSGSELKSASCRPVTGRRYFPDTVPWTDAQELVENNSWKKEGWCYRPPRGNFRWEIIPGKKK